VYVYLFCRSSPVLQRFSKQLKMGLLDSRGLLDSCREDSTAVSPSVGRLSGVLTSTLSSSTIETCQGHLCLTDSSSPQHSSNSPLPSKLSSGPETSHARRMEKNIFTSIRLTEVTSDELTKTDTRADRTILSDSVEKEISAESGKCQVSSLLFSDGERMVESSSVSCRNGSIFDDAISGDVKADCSDPSQSMSYSEIQSSGDAMSEAELTSFSPEREGDILFDENCKIPGIQPDVRVCVSRLDSNVAGSIVQQSGHRTQSDGDIVGTRDSNTDQYRNRETENREVVKDNEDADSNSSATVDLTCVASHPITPVDIAAKNDTEVRRTQLQALNFHESSPEKIFPADYIAHGSIEIAKPSVAEDITGVNETSGCCSLVKERDFAHQCQMLKKRHNLRPSQLEDCHTLQATSSELCADRLKPQLTLVSSCPMPVSVFCAQSSTTSTPVPVALFCAQPSSSATPGNGRVSNGDVQPDSCGASFPHSTEVSVSVSYSRSEIPCLMVQGDPSQFLATVREETDSAGSDGIGSKCAVSSVISSCHTVRSTGIQLSSDIPTSDMPLCLSDGTCISVLPTHNQELSQQCSTVSQVSNESISISPQCPITDRPEMGIHTEEKNCVVSNDVPVLKYNISDFEQIPDITALKDDRQIEVQKDIAVTNERILDDIPETDCCMEDGKGFDRTSSAMPVSGYNVSDLRQLEGDHQTEEQKVVVITNSDEANECISDESIVSQILAADCCRSESLSELVPHSLVSDCSEHQKWREIVSPAVSSKQCLHVLEDSSDSLSVTADSDSCKSFMDMRSSDKDLIQSTEWNVSTPNPGISGTLCEEHRGGDLALVPSYDAWIYDTKELQDVLCSLLNSCHMNSTDPDNSLPSNDDDDDDDARSCLSSATEVYVESSEDLKVDDVSDHCDSPPDKDSDGTVSLLSVVLDGDGLDLMDSTSDGFQNIYSSLVGAAAMDTVLSSDANELNSSTYCSNASTANLSAFAVEQNLTSLLDKEGSSAVMALDANLVKNLPCPTASVASLCDKLEDSGQQAKKDDEDDLHTDVGKPKKSVSCYCSKPHTSKKSCRSSLRMPEKLADVDPSSPLLACRPPPLSVQCGTYVTDVHRTSDIAECSENTTLSSVSVKLTGLDVKTLNKFRSRKRKASGVSDADNETDVKRLSGADDKKSDEEHPAEISPAASETGKKHKKYTLKSFRNVDKIQVMPGNLSKTSLVKIEKNTFRISASQVKKPVNYTCSVLKGQTVSEERPTMHRMRSHEQIQQTTFTLEHTRTGSTRTVILRKPTCPPMLGIGKPSTSKSTPDHVSNRQQSNCSQICSDTQHGKKEKKRINSPEKPHRQFAADNSASVEIRNEVASDVENDTDEEFSLKKMVLRSDRHSSFKQSQARSKNSNRASQDNRSGVSRKKYGNGNDRSVLDVARGSGSIGSQGKRRKRNSLLAQLENSEGYVADRSVSQQPQHDNSSLLWSDSCTLSREERALQVSFVIANQSH